MDGLWAKTLSISFNASGAVMAACQRKVIMIVDVIDMSTTAESALEAGALEVMGASPVSHEVPLELNPERIGFYAGKIARKNKTEVIIVSEPRVEKYKEKRQQNIVPVVKGIKNAGSVIDGVIPNIGKNVNDLGCLRNKIVVVVSSAGGVTYDAAFNNGAAKVITGTTVSTNKLKGDEPAEIAANRAIKAAEKYKTGISIIASSSNAREDILSAEYIAEKIVNKGFLNYS